MTDEARSADRPVLRVGCPMWVNRDWVGVHWPPDTPRGDELATYARWCNAVEGNTTFYAVPSETTVQRWAEQAPPGFRFVFKLPREVTHLRRLRDVDGEVTTLTERLAPLGDRIGLWWVQLPESFGPGDVGVLLSFLDRRPAGTPWTVEVRHPDFGYGSDADRRLNEALAARGVDRTLFDTAPLFADPPRTVEEAEAHSSKPRLPVWPVALAGRPMVRLIAPDAPRARAAWVRWVPHVARWVNDGREPFVFTHTPDNVDAPVLARWFHGQVAEAVEDLAPLGDPHAVRGQGALW